jgi:hypothetical protein
MRTTPTLAALALSATVLAPGGCVFVRGNGVPAHEARPLDGFIQVANRSALDVRVVQGGAFSVVVTTDANLLRLVTTEVVGDVLTVSQRRSFRPRTSSHVEVTMPIFSGADLSGSGSLSVDAGTTRAITLRNSGSGALRYTGRAGPVAIDLAGSGATTLTGAGDTLDGSLSGSGALEAASFLVGGSTFSLSGSGSARLAVSGNSTLSISGSGSVQATLNGGIANASVSGSGSITWSGTSIPGAATTTGSGRISHY